MNGTKVVIVRSKAFRQFKMQLVDRAELLIGLGLDGFVMEEKNVLLLLRCPYEIDTMYSKSLQVAFHTAWIWI